MKEFNRQFETPIPTANINLGAILYSEECIEWFVMINKEYGFIILEIEVIQYACKLWSSNGKNWTSRMVSFELVE